MKTLYSYVLTTIFSLYCGFSWASESSVTQLQALLPQDCKMLGQFVQTQKKQQLTAPLIQYGRFVFHCEKGLIWETQSPIEESTVYRKSGNPVQIIDNKTIELDGMAMKKLGKILNQLMGGDTSELNKNFVIQVNESEATLIPKKRRMKKFLESIQIEKTPDGAQMFLQHPNNEYDKIAISITETFSELDDKTCHDRQFVHPLACQNLFP